MRLLDLDPRWLSPDMFIFRNPTGGGDWLTCKRKPMLMKQQRELIYGDWRDPSTKTEWCGTPVVMTNPETAWAFSGEDFATLSVSPSIDASASGNWHGFITDGEIQ